MKRFKDKLSHILKNNEMFLNIFSIVVSSILRFVGKFIPINNNQLLITANSMGYNDSPRVIFEKVMLDSKFRDLKIYWALDNPEKLPSQYRGLVQIVKPDTVTYFKVALQSKYWLTSVNIERGLQFKKEETIFLNTWHGIPIKTVGNAVKGRKDFNWEKTDFICYSNEEEKDIYVNDFNANPANMIASGLPRNDELYDVDKNKVLENRKKLGLPKDKKVIIYAPTWRDNSDFGSDYKLDVPIDWQLWERQLSDDYIVLLKAHPYTTKLMGITFNEFIRDFHDYPTVNDLLIVSDILISDYSSIIYDYSILEKPIICFAYDYEEYKSSRGLYFDLHEEMPSGVISSELDVLAHIQTLDFKKESLASKALKEKRVTYGGNATNTCIRLLFERGLYESKN